MASYRAALHGYVVSVGSMNIVLSGDPEIVEITLDMTRNLAIGLDVRRNVSTTMER